MDLFTVLNLIALMGLVGLNSRMNGYRETWMRRMLARESRMVDKTGGLGASSSPVRIASITTWR